MRARCSLTGRGTAGVDTDDCSRGFAGLHPEKIILRPMQIAVAVSLAGAGEWTALEFSAFFY